MKKTLETIFWAALMPIVCLADIGLDSESVEVAKDYVGTREIPINGDGDWTASTDATWLKIVRASSASASKPVFRVTGCNYSTDVREAIVKVNELSYVVRQLAYGATITPEQVELGPEGMSSAGLVQIDVEEAKSGANVSWTAKLKDSQCDWISILPESGVGDGAVSYRVSENTNTIERIGIVTIAGQRFTVTQAGAAQTDPGETVIATVVPTKFTLSASSHEVEAVVAAEATATWTIENNAASWINVFNSGTGKGNATLGIAVSANKSVYSRTGTLVIGGSTLTIIQKGSVDYLLTTEPDTASYAYTGGTKTIDVLASDDMDWSVASLASWITVQTPRTLSGCGDGSLKYQVALNTTLEARTNALEFTAKIPHPEIEISRGLMQWKGVCQAIGYAFNDPALRDPEVTGETEGVWFTITNHMNSLHRLFDLNDGQAGLYVTTENRLVLDDTSGNVVDLNFPIEQNVIYDLFIASSGTNTVLYGGIQGCGAYRRLYEGVPVLKITGYGRSTKPSNTTSQSEELLIWGRTSTTAYYYWTRMLNASEMLNMPNEKPLIVFPSESIYTNMYSYAPMDRLFVWLSGMDEHTIEVEGINFLCSRNLLSNGAMSGDSMAISLPINIAVPSSKYEQRGIASSFSDFRKRGGIGVGDSTRNLVTLGTYSLWIKLCESHDDVSIFEMLRVARFTKWSHQSYYDRSFGGNRNYYECTDTYFYPTAEKGMYELQYSDKGFSFVEDGIQTGYFGGDEISFGNWMMVTVSWNADKMTLYLNGKDIGNVQISQNHPLFCLDWWMAYGHAGNIVFDDIKIFNDRLSTDQIKEIYNLEKPLKFRHVVTQEAATPTLSGTSCTCESAQGDYTVGLTLPNSRIRWTASTDAEWITLSETSGTGSATIHFTVAKNTETYERRGVITIAGVRYEVIQKGTGISFAKTIYQIAYDGTETLDVPVLASDSDTHWTVVEDTYRYPWLGTDTPEGTGSSMLSVWGAANSNEMDSRHGILMVSGVWLYVFQRDYDLNLAPASTNMLHAAGRGEIVVTTEEPDCGNWQAITDVDWISLEGAEDGEISGTGDGVIAFSVAENTTGTDRIGRIVVAGETCVITQKTKGVVTGLTIDGPKDILTGTTTNYTAYLVYSSGWTEPVTPSWSIPGSAGVTMTTDGRFISGETSGEVTINAAYVVGGVEYRANQKVVVSLRPTSLEIVGRSTSLCPGEKRALDYKVTFTDGTTDFIKPTSVSVTKGSASVDAEGVLTAGKTAGEVSLAATYVIVGVAVSATYSTSIARPNVQQALDSDLNYELTGWKAVGAESHTGDYSLQAGPLEVGETVEVSTTVVGAGSLSCWVKIATASDSSVAHGELLVDGIVVKTVWGVADWTNLICPVSTWGEHVIVWRYVKSTAGYCGEDCIWLDDVVWTATPVVPVSLSIQGNDRVVAAQTAQYVCVVQYNEGSSKSVTASWAVVSGNDCVEINTSSGLLTAKKNGTARIQASYTECGVTKTAVFDVTIVKGVSGVTVSGLSKLYAGDSSQYVCTATYTDGSSLVVSANWTLTNGGNCASLNSSGLLTALDADGEAAVKASYTHEGITKSAIRTVQIARQIAVSSDTTGGKPANVPGMWIQKYPKFKTQFGSDFEAAMSVPTGKKDGANKSLNVWHDYVAGTDPTDVKDVFRAKVEMVDGLPHVSWEPNLNEEGETRTYKVYGRRSLAGSDTWEYPANSAVHQFFKVNVAMPDDNDGGSDSPGTVDSWLSVVVPTAVPGLVYDGTVKQGVLAGTGYLLSNASATGAGNYVATATLVSGYKWANGTQESQSIPWAITKADNSWEAYPSMSATKFLAGAVVKVTDGVPKIGSVTRNYSDSALRLLPAGSYTLTSSVSESANYAGLTYSIPFVVTNPVTKVSLPTAKSGLVYAGSSQTGVSSGTGYTITGNTAVNAGSYTATATLQDGYVWSDGTTSKSRTISWSISKATNSWLTEPSLSSTEFAEGTAVTISMGAVKFGVRQANYTAAELAELPAGSYTLVVSVAVTDNYTGLTKSIPFTVTEVSHSVTGVSIDPTYLTLNGIGMTRKIVATVLPLTADDKSVVWSSSDTSVATVTDGLVTAVGLGETTVSVTTCEGGFSKSLSVSVASECISAGTNLDISNVKLYSGSNYPKSGNGAWTLQSSQVHDGTVAIRSGSRIDRSYDSHVITIVNGSGTISFWWKVSSSAYDKLRFYSEGNCKAEISGVGGGWQFVSVRFDGWGYRRLRWCYVGNSSKAGEDCGWVDCIKWTPDDVSANPVTQIVISGNDSMTSQQRKTYEGKIYYQNGYYNLTQSLNLLSFGAGEIIPIWTIDEPNTLATIDPYTGVLSANGAVGTITVRATYSENGVTVSATKTVVISD